MTETRFTWREDKNRSNQRKHGISFEVAARVFLDPLHVTRQDRIEDGELRWQTIGRAYGITLLLVAHTVTEDDEGGRPMETIHIISARKADRSERNRYDTQTD